LRRHFHRTECSDASPATDTCSTTDTHSATNSCSATNTCSRQGMLHMGGWLWRLWRRWYWLVPYVGIELRDMHWELQSIRVPPILLLSHTCANDGLANYRTSTADSCTSADSCASTADYCTSTADSCAIATADATADTTADPAIHRRAVLLWGRLLELQWAG